MGTHPRAKASAPAPVVFSAAARGTKLRQVFHNYVTVCTKGTESPVMVPAGDLGPVKMILKFCTHSGAGIGVESYEKYFLCKLKKNKI